MKRAMRLIPTRLSVILFPMWLAACGGGGSAPATIDPSNQVTVTGVVTYTGYPLSTSSGINYNSPIEKPIRGAVVEIRNENGTVLSRGNTSTTGGYSLAAPSNTAITVLVKAALGDPLSPNTYVVDNTDGNALYSLFSKTTTSNGGTTNHSFNAPSGWGGNSYTSTRSAAPFAILDTIYQAQQLVLGANSSATFPQLIAHWSENNTTADGSISNGEIGTSFYSNGGLYILGAENLDSDEYDQHIIAHEWGHYFEDQFSRSDSIGGVHGFKDLLDPTVAFSEGFGNAIAGMIMGTPDYIDTKGSKQSVSALHIDLESDAVSDSEIETDTNSLLFDGYYSETSIQEVLFDLYDSKSGDDDVASLGFGPIFTTLTSTNSYKDTPAMASIFTFLHHLKQNSPAQSAAIESVAAAENIPDGNEYEGFSEQFYTTITVGVLRDTDLNGNPLRTYTTYGPEDTATNSRNKLLNRRFFKTTIPSSGCYKLTVTPTNPIIGNPVIYAPGNIYINHNMSSTATETFTKSFVAGDEWAFAVGSIGGNTYFQVRISSAPDQC